jgi:hypothetical protein
MFGKRLSRALAMTLIGLLVMTAAAFAADLKTDLDLSSNSPQRDVALGNVAGAASGQIDTGVYYSGTSGTVTFAVDSMPPFVTGASGDTLTAPGISNAKHSLIDWVAPCSVGAFSGTVTYKVTFEDLSGTVGVADAYINISGNVTTACVTNHAPVVAADAASVTVDEGSAAAMTGTWSDADAGDTVTLSASYGTVVKAGTNAAGTWSWSATPDDGPADSQTVTITANDGTGTGNATATTTFGLVVNNLPPTITSLTPNVTNVLVGAPVTFTGQANDPSGADTLAGFQWAFDTGSGFGSYGLAGANTFTTSFATCGTHTIDAKAKDKDGGESAAFTSDSVSTYDAHFQAPLREGVHNLVQKSSVVPVKIVVSCNGSANLTGLSPAIRLLNGDVDPNTDPDDPDYIVQPSVSSADTTGVMRLTGDGTQYIYNLMVPAGTKGQLYTIAVYPFGANGGSIKVVLEIRK